MKTIGAMALFACLACSQAKPSESTAPATNLFQASRTGDLAATVNLLKSGADVHARDGLGNTPLMAAALNADVAVLELLLKAGADVSAANQVGATALMRAATFEDKTRLLVARGADVKARSRLGNTALILAARSVGNSRTVEFLLDHGADPNATNVLGATPLQAAAAASDADSVRILLDRGALVDAKPSMDVNGFAWGGGRTALMWAAFQGNESLIKLLLKRGAKVNEFTVGGGALAQAAWGGQVGAARLLLEAGAQVDQRDLVANYTPLHWAACSERSSPDLTQLLLAHGADANAEGGQPVDNFLGVAQSPLSLARKRGDTPIVRALLKAGAKDSPASTRSVKALEPAAGGSGGRTVVDAIQRALPPLTKTAEESVCAFLRHASNQDCVSCHQQQLPLPALSLAHSRHLTTDRQAVRHQIQLLERSFWVGHIKQGGEQHSILEMDLQTTFHPEPAIVDGYAAMDLQLENEPASEATDSMIHQLATIQHADGHWSWNLPRPPIQASDITATAQAVYTLQAYSIPARQQELHSRVQRAQEWLRKVKAETNEELVHQLLGLAWAGEKSGALKSLAEELIRHQRPDGGWSQLAGLESDAYGTGQSLYALMEGEKVPATHPAVRRGIDFLLRAQLADGTWLVRTRSHPFQPPMESSFPHGKDSWISSAGSSWAVMALATSLDPAQVRPTAPIAAEATAPTGPVKSPSLAGSSPANIEFARDIQPLLERSCVACHSGERPKGGLQITDRASLIHGGKRGEPAIVPNHSEESPLIRLVSDQVEDLEMPPLGRRDKFPPLTKDETALLIAWIDRGAAWPEGATLHAQAK